MSHSSVNNTARLQESFKQELEERIYQINEDLNLRSNQIDEGLSQFTRIAKSVDYILESQKTFEIKIQKQGYEINENLNHKINKIEEKICEVSKSKYRLDDIYEGFTELREDIISLSKSNDNNKNVEYQFQELTSQYWELVNSDRQIQEIKSNQQDISLRKAQNQESYKLDKEASTIVKLFNDDSENFLKRYASYYKLVKETKDSFSEGYTDRFQSLCLEVSSSGIFLVICFEVIAARTYWLVPKPDEKPNEFTSSLWELLFGYDGKRCSRYKLIKPAKLRSLKDRADKFILEDSGEIEFIL